jgi:hypothetical protein
MEGEALLLDLERNACFALNATGALIWQRLGEGDSPQEITARVAQAFAVDEASARRDLDAFITLLLAQGLLLRR